MGYNGYIPGAPHISRVHENHEQSIIHSEINAIADCAKRGASLESSKIYVTNYPYINCFKSVAICGIKEVYSILTYKLHKFVLGRRTFWPITFILIIIIV